MTLVIADDQERERIWLRDLLSKNLPDCNPVYEATNGQQAVDLALSHKPAIVFLDIEMPILSGIKAAENIIQHNPQTAICILSNHSDEVWVRQLWKIVPADGAFAYILKDATDNQVVEATRAVLSGDCWIHPRVQRIARRLGESPASLTESEFEVLVAISLGLTDKAIARRLYITEKAVQARLKCLYQKLSIPIKGSTDTDEYNHRCRAMNIAFRRGLINKLELEDWEVKLGVMALD